MSEHLTIILEEMFRRVGKKYSPKITAKPDWYLKNTWTEEEKEDFVKWLRDYLYKTKGARNEIMNVPRKNLKYCEKVARFFDFNYGWRVK